jgi:hypothetical protein
MSDEPEKQQTDEKLLSRWSRLKQEARQQPAVQKQTEKPQIDPAAPAPELTPVEQLNFDSDYKAFLHPKVDDALRRTALKKLFSDPHFNVIDLMDVYIDDYTLPNVLPPEMLAQLRHAKKILDWAKEGTAEEESKAAELSAENAPQQLTDAASSQDSAPDVPVVEPTQKLEGEEQARPQTPATRKTQA